jgi:hypothetical protein
LIERVWWSWGDEHDPPEQSKKSDRPLTMERAAFRPNSNAVLHVWFPKVHWVEFVLVGFGEERQRTYLVRANSRLFSLPLREFGDAAEIQDTTRDATLKLWLPHEGAPGSGVEIARVPAEVSTSILAGEELVAVPVERRAKEINFCSTCDHARFSGGWVWCRRHHWYRVSMKTYQGVYIHNWCDEWQGEYVDDKGHWHTN